MSEAELNKLTLAHMKNSLATVLENVTIQKYVKVDLIKNCSYVGFLHSVDPVTISVILSVPHGDGYKTVLIPGHTIVNISFEERPVNLIPPQKKETQTESKEDIFKRKTKLISWFKTNLLPVIEMNDRVVIGNVTLLQPYRISDISTDNPIIAMRIKNIIEQMPEDFEPK